MILAERGVEFSMSTVHNSVETVNAAATAIVTAESRGQPVAVQKRRWGICLSFSRCFGSYKQSKQISHAVLISEPTEQLSMAPLVDIRNSSSTMVLPFMAPPSSPASVLPSTPPTSLQSSAGLLSLASLSVHAYESSPIFAIGPYANETQLVSPPVFSTFTTEPSTASFTPPPESVQMTTPSSPEVPFARFLSNRRNLKYSFSQHEFQPYQYSGSPGGNLKSPGSDVSSSGTSSPCPSKPPVIDLRIGETAKFIGYEQFMSSKLRWGSRISSGSMTPNGGVSRLGSGTLTPNAQEKELLPSRDSNIPESQTSRETSLANSIQEVDNDVGTTADPRVSFELISEYIPTSIVRQTAHSKEVATAEGKDANENGYREQSHEETVDENDEGDECSLNQRTVSIGSSKEFNFNAEGEEDLEKSAVDCEWWTGEKVADKRILYSPQDYWTFFTVLQSGIS